MKIAPLAYATNMFKLMDADKKNLPFKDFIQVSHQESLLLPSSKLFYFVMLSKFLKLCNWMNFLFFTVDAHTSNGG
jgi:hypothetical protein